MRITDFDIYKNILKERSGLSLTPDKSYLLESRLNPVAKKWGFSSLEAMTVALQGVPDPNLIIDIVESMTTNETSFFRDGRPFEIFKDFIVPYLEKSRGARRSFKIWCAAASSGQEPYTLALVLKELQENILAGWRPSIVATDISHEILEQAKTGIYSQFEVQRGLPIQMLLKYFIQDGDKWQVQDDLKNLIEYKYFNLLDSMSGLGKFDIIFCRNVLIYFDESTKRNVLERMAAQLEPDGFLFLGGAETVLGVTDVFVPLPDKRGLYVHKDSIHLEQGKSQEAQALA